MDSQRRDEEKRWLEKVEGVIGLLFVSAIVAVVGYYGVTWLWPIGITDMPLASLTLGLLSRAAGACLVAFVAGGVVLMFISVILEQW